MKIYGTKTCDFLALSLIKQKIKDKQLSLYVSHAPQFYLFCFEIKKVQKNTFDRNLTIFSPVLTILIRGGLSCLS